MTIIKARWNEEELKEFTELQTEYGLLKQYGGDSQTIKKAVRDALKYRKLIKKLKDFLGLEE